MQRFNTYFHIQPRLALLGDDQIKELLKRSKARRGWGINHLIKIDGKKIFVKRIPLTMLEYKNPFSTRNHYRLPLYYNYGVGSAGFGAWRELATHIKTTSWVLNGENSHFPLMYHFRILKRDEPFAEVDKASQKKYRAYWNSNKQIDKYTLARKKARYEIVIFLEHIPGVINDLFVKNPSRVPEMFDEITETIIFMRRKGMIHFDLHLHNILTDGKNFYLTDFGLCLDKKFQLTKTETQFHRTHATYDKNEFISSLGHVLLSHLGRLPKRQQKALMNEMQFPPGADNFQGLEILYKNFDKLNFLDKKFLLLLKKHKKIILKMTRFTIELRADSTKKTKYPF